MRKLVMVTAVLAACGTDPVALDDYASEVHDAYCRYLARCGAIEDLETCRKLEIGLHVRLSASELAAIDAGRTRFDGEAARSCFDALAERSCDTTSRANRAEPDACRDIVTGRLHGGEVCTGGDQCISRSCETPSCNMACCLGTCAGDAAPGIAKAGESCEFAACDEASFCDEEIMMCIALRPRDAFCVSGAECAYGLGCVQGGTCATLPSLGQACTGPCRDEGTTCGSTATCVEVKLAGESCVTSADCARVYRCDSTKRCSAGPPLGAQCTAAQRCADDGAFCDVPQGESFGTCVLPKPDGSSCQRDEHCQSLTCDPIMLRCLAEPVCL